MFTPEVVIVGAGPGGLAAAFHLGQKGVNTLLADQATFPRDKVCGDGISGWAVDILKKLDPGIIDELTQHPYSLDSWGVRFVAPNLKSIDIPYSPKKNANPNQPAGFIIKRFHFDNFLWEKVKHFKTVKTVEGLRMENFTYRGDRVILSSKSGKTAVSAKVAIVADGAQSALGKKMNGNFLSLEKKHHMAGVRGYFKGVRHNHAKNYIEMHFLKELLPGYFWIFPLPDGLANVGICIRSDKVSQNKLNLRELLDEVIESNAYLNQRFFDAKKISPVRGFGLPLGSQKRDLSCRNMMKVGDAAGLVDPFTGEGIGNALASGLYAAQNAIKCVKKNDFSLKSMSAYDELVYQKLGHELRLSTSLQHLLKYPRLFNLVVNKASKNVLLRDVISSMFVDPDIKSHLKNPMFYLRVLFG